MDKILDALILKVGMVILSLIMHTEAINAMRPLSKSQGIHFDDKSEINKRDIAGHTALFCAVKAGNKTQTEMLLRQGASVHEKVDASSQHSILHWAAQHSDADIMRLLLETEVDLRLTTEQDGQLFEYGDPKMTDDLIMSAAQNKRRSVTALLLEKGADVIAVDDFGRTALHVASSLGNADVVDLLMEKDSSKILLPDSTGRTPVHCAVLNRQSSTTKLLILKEKYSINAVDDGGRTPLHHAAATEDAETVFLLLKEGANHLVKDKHGKMAIDYARENGKTGHILKQHMSKNKQSQTENELQDTPLHEAVLKSCKTGDDSAISLIEKGVYARVVGKWGWTPLHCACLGLFDPSNYRIAIEKARFIIKALIDKGVDIDTRDNSGNGPLHIAAKMEAVYAVEELLAANAPTVSINKYGETPLHLAAVSNCADIAKLLIEKGADVNAKDKGGNTPLHRAACFGDKWLLLLLIEKGAVKGVVNNEGKTPLALARERDVKDIDVEAILAR